MVVMVLVTMNLVGRGYRHVRRWKMLACATCKESNVNCTSIGVAVVKLVAAAAAAAHNTCRNQWPSFGACAVWLGGVSSSLPARSVPVI